MDEGLLNDLLECSVCLERLDTSSRVLPCQHTFCLKCLKVIVESHKELRCPECRILVEAKVQELPPNVLLMRILEGMKNSAPARAAPAAALRAARGHHSPQAGQQSSHGHTRSDGKQLPPHARAMYDYNSKEIGDMSFKKGETILLTKRLDPFWYQGETSGRSGMFPISYVQVVVPLPMPTALCKALYDFRMSAPDEEGCLAFDKGAIITVHRRVDENWAEGRIDDRVGIFPIAFVELNQAARQLMNSPTLNRPVPPTPEHSRAGHSDHRHHGQHSHRYQPMSMSTPTTVGNYQNIVPMSQSHPNYHQPPMLQPQSQILVSQPIGQHGVTHGLVTTTAVPRNIMEPTQTKHLELIHFTNMHNKSGHQTMGLQSVSRINDGLDRLRAAKYENYNSTPLHKAETTYQNVRNHTPMTVASFNTNVSSDSSSSVNTPVGISSTTTPNTSSDTSTCESGEPSLPSSPDNHLDRNAAVTQPITTQSTVQNDGEAENQELNTSMGVLSLNESSTATNTSLNVSLPPSDSPVTAVAEESANHSEPSRLDTPSSSKVLNPVRSGPDSLLNFGLGLQAALSPSHGKDGNYLVPRGHREHNRERDKRHSLTPSTHLNSNQHSSQNRHSAEILATSLLDHTPERERSERERERDKRRRRSRSNERPLPAAYIALYPYKPQKPDELELRKGNIYTVTERCRDGWFKGCSERTQRCGVFPGNYVTPTNSIRPKHDKQLAPPPSVPAATPSPAATTAPDAPPRAPSPPHPAQWPAAGNAANVDKGKEKSKVEKSSISSGVSLMKRLAAMKKCKSPPLAGYSMDNPVFEDGPGTSLLLVQSAHPVHVRSGSCPSQLLRALPASAEARGTSSHRVRAKERPSVLAQDTYAHHTARPGENPWQSQHRKSQSLDVTAVRRDRDRHHSQPIKERFRCIVPYPPNSEYELELKVDDIVLVHRKRGDGWYKGTLQRTGRTGLFPASFVQSFPPE